MSLMDGSRTGLKRILHTDTVPLNARCPEIQKFSRWLIEVWFPDIASIKLLGSLACFATLSATEFFSEGQ
jgi:hypothetical protein